ncbi:MAG: SUMF1/EgtB/PvdO family nonheme iron enzyme [Chitinophagaceae bacterium]|nr:SUMF1/EgtB/PvdO family nonheme iron enzyme [Chitinophagaceae bacterium]
MNKLIILTIALMTMSNVIMAQNTQGLPEKPEVIEVIFGRFNMGNRDAGTGSGKYFEGITVDTYYIGKYPITVEQFFAFCKETQRNMPIAPDWDWQARYPMVKVEYLDAVSYCEWLSKKYGGTWRLPTEAEWEFAARGGRDGRWYKYSGSNDLEEVGWYRFSDKEKDFSHNPYPVGLKKPNELGIYDMTGNVWEWCSDKYSESFYISSGTHNPKNKNSSGVDYVIRGGDFFSTKEECLIYVRDKRDGRDRMDNVGFRVVYIPFPKPKSGVIFSH